jgi:hypothetical protein
MVASSETHHGTATVNIPHQGPYQYLYKGIWHWVCSIIAYFHNNFFDDYDFISFLSGDDTYLIVENLKALLTSQQMIDYAGGTSHYPNPVYLGSWTHPIWF